MENHKNENSQENKDSILNVGLRDSDIKPIHDLLVEDTLYGDGTYTNEKEGKDYMLSISTEGAISKWKDDFVVTIYDQNTLVGFGKSDNTGWVTHVFVGKENQRKGYGALILKKLEELMKEKGIKHIKLTAEPKAVDFYQKYNWKKTEEEPYDFHGMALVIMEKSIDMN